MAAPHDDTGDDYDQHCEVSEENENNENLPLVIVDLLRMLEENKRAEDPLDTTPLPVAAMKCLLEVIRRSKSNTMMGLQDELRHATDDMMDYAARHSARVLRGKSYFSMASGCDLFLQYVTRTFLELPSFDDCISQVLERAERLADVSLSARSRIAAAGRPFLRDGQTVLTHGYSRVVVELLVEAARAGARFSVVVAEGRPDAGGARMARDLAEKAGVPATVVLDSAVANVMERCVDAVVVGAEGVAENGGIVNKIGTYGMGVLARELGKPFYVAVESYKFTRSYPLNNSDLPEMRTFAKKKREETTADADAEPSSSSTTTADGAAIGDRLDFVDTTMTTTAGSLPRPIELPDGVRVENPPCDFTPAKYITLLFTDIGVFTPSAVSDELIRLYQ